MILIILSIVLLFLALAAVALQRLYSSVPARELKRLSAAGDHIARALYRPVAHGANLRLLLWAVAVLGLAGGFAMLSVVLPVWATFVAMCAVLVVGFIWLPSLRLTGYTATLASWFSPIVAFSLQHLHGVLHPVASAVQQRRRIDAHSRLYEKADLKRLLHQQKEQSDNRITEGDLELAERALSFGERCAADIALPRAQMCIVSADDSVGPILLDQLHKSGQTSFLVYKDTPENVVGMLRLKDAVAVKQGGRVMDLIRADITYVHEDFSLPEVLAALRHTTQQMVAVINSFEELVGIITLENLLDELLGHGQHDELPVYDNRAEVAAYRRDAAAKTQPPQISDEGHPGVLEEPASPEAPEVIE